MYSARARESFARIEKKEKEKEEEEEEVKQNDDRLRIAEESVDRA